MYGVESGSSDSSENKPRPIVYGYLGNGWQRELGRGRLMLALSRTNPVILLERDSNVSHRAPHMEAVAPNRYVLRNAMRWRTSRIGKRVARLAAIADGAALNRVLRSAGFGDFVYWLTVNDRRMLYSMPTHRLVYDCMDPCFFPERQREFDASEFAIARRARLVVCSGGTLLARMKKVNSRSCLLPNACANDTYEACHSPQMAAPAKLAGRKGPFIGYMGTIDWRFDAATVTQVARLMPDCTFVIVGRVNADQEAGVQELRAMPHVIFAGSVDYDEGHAYTRAFDACLIPFTPGPMNDAINSVKMYMYLAAGKPIVSTWLAECVQAKGWVAATRDPREFIEALREALANDSAGRRQARTAFALANTWDNRAAEALRLMRDHGVLCN